MKTNAEVGASVKAFQDACRKKFAFLIDSFGFKEAGLTADFGPDQVTFEKGSWKIVICGTSYGTSASIFVFSPDNQWGQFRHLIDEGFETQRRPEFEPGQLGEVGFLALCLRTFGSAFLKGQWDDFGVLQQRQREELVKCGVMSEAQLKSYEELYG
jgi:hypothetical protein